MAGLVGVEAMEKATMRRYCFSCGDDWGDHFPCRLSDEDNPEEWVQVFVCSTCWKNAERAHEARLRETERQLLASWVAPEATA